VKFSNKVETRRRRRRAFDCNATARVNAARAIELLQFETDARLRQPDCTAQAARITIVIE
jgi:hypothetical protein